MKPPFTIEFRDITPEQALDWLQTKNIGNRAMKKDTIIALARDMINDDWITNHQGIAFGDSGNLIDGQNRLAAIVKSKKTIRMLVFWNVPEKPEGKKLSAIASIDRGAPRTIGDILRLEHGFKKDQSFIAQFASAMVILSLADSQRARKLSIGQVLRVIEIVAEDTRWILEKRPAGKVFNSAAVLAPFAWARPIAPALIDEMLTKFITGAGLEEGDPMLGLRNYLIQSSGSNRSSASSREIRLRLGEVALCCIWHGIHGKPLNTVKEGAPNHVDLVAWMRDKRKELISRIEAIFPAITSTVIGQEKKKRIKERPAAPESDPIAESPILSAKDIKLTPLAESLVTGKIASERIHAKLARTEGPKMSDGRSRKEVLREIANRVR